MRRLNRTAAEALRPAAPRAVTDVTGFGLLGHLHEMLAASAADGEVWTAEVPVLEGTRRLVEQGEVPGGTTANAAHAATFTTFDEDVDAFVRTLLADAQTSGGLLAAVDAEALGPVLERLRAQGDAAAVVGRVATAGSGRIAVRRARA